MSTEVSFPHPLLPFALLSICLSDFVPQLCFILISTPPASMPHASLLTDSMSWCRHARPAPVWGWVKRLLNFGSDDPGREQSMFRTQLQLLCAFAYPRPQLPEPQARAELWVPQSAFILPLYWPRSQRTALALLSHLLPKRGCSLCDCGAQ